MKRRLRILSAFALLLAVASAPPTLALDEQERLWLVGSSAFADGLYPLARRVLERFVVEYADDARASAAFLMLGKARLNAGDAAAALEAFRLGQTFNPLLKLESVRLRQMPGSMMFRRQPISTRRQGRRG